MARFPLHLIVTSQDKAAGRVWHFSGRTVMLGLALALVLAGCSESPGGSTRPGGYTCAAPSNPYGCWTQLGISPTHTNTDGHADIPGLPLSDISNLFVAPLTCDATCQASSGGGANPPGYIANYVMLWQQSTGWFVRAGYMTTPDGLQYFAQYWLSDVSPPYQTLYMAPAHATPPYTYARVGVGGGVFQAYSAWEVDVSEGSDSNWVNDKIGDSSFKPDFVFYGQTVYGTSGATADFAVFTHNFISTSSGYAVLQEDGVPPSPVATVDHPTDSGWFYRPASTGYGGMFYVSCCQPLS